MADLRIGGIPSGATPVLRPISPARAEAVKAAQRAFFETALRGEMQAASTATPVQPVAAPSPARNVSFDPQAPQPTTLLRPGSLLNIKV